MRLRLGSGCDLPSAGMTGGFSVSALFFPNALSASQGAVYDPSNLASMYQDAAGTTPVTAPGLGTADSPVGLMLDTRQSLVRGPELFETSVPSGTGWGELVSTPANTGISGSQFTFGGQYSGRSNNTAVVAGKSYELSFTMTVISGNTSGFSFYHAGLGANFTLMASSFTVGVPKRVSIILVATATGSADFGIQDRNVAGWGTVSIPDFSFKEIPGTHATQSTSTARPVLTARVNLLQDTAALTTGWNRDAGSTFQNFPNGGMDDLPYTRITTGVGGIGFSFNMSVVAGTTYYVSLGVRLISGSKPYIVVVFNDGGTQVVPTSSWTRQGFALTASSTGTIGFRIDRTTTAGAVYDICAPQVEVNSVATRYQRVTDASNYDTVGFPWYIKYDGIDDTLLIAGLTGMDALSITSPTGIVTTSYPTPLTQINTNFSAASWLPVDQGAWYDPSDLTSLYQDAAGTTPVTAMEQPVGLMLDKRLGLVRGVELITNGGFDSGANWSFYGTAGVSIAGGVLIFNDAGSALSAVNTGTVVAGKTYEAVFTVSNYVSGGASLTYGTLLATLGSISNANGTLRQVFVAPVSDVIGVRGRGANCVFNVDNFSVRELPGNHATQPTAAARPVVSARVNLLLQTNDLTNGIWNKRGTATASNTPAPDGTGQLLAGLGVVGANDIYQINGLSGSGPLATSFLVWPVTLTGTMKAYNPNNINSGEWSINLALLTPGQWNVVTATHPAVTVVAAFAVNAGGGLHFAYSSGGTASAYVKNPHQEYGTAASPRYQRVTDATNYDAVGFPTYLKFDGVDDFLSTGSIDFTGTDKMTVWAAPMRATNTIGCLVELSADASGANNGAFYMFNSVPTTTSNYQSGMRGTSMTLRDASVAINTAAVLTGVYNISAPSHNLRANGVDSVFGGSAGTGNFGNYPIYIGRRAGTTLPFNGNLYGLTIRGAASTAAQIASTERYLASKSGVTLP